jgi:hypothetical protein
MEWTLLEVVLEFFQDARLYTILGLIVLDVVMGVAVAIKNGEFVWFKVGQFYRTMVAPYVIGYLALYVMFGVVPGLEGIVGEGLHAVAYGAIVVNLLGSVVSHLQALGLRREVDRL